MADKRRELQEQLEARYTHTRTHTYARACVCERVRTHTFARTHARAAGDARPLSTAFAERSCLACIHICNVCAHMPTSHLDQEACALLWQLETTARADERKALEADRRRQEAAAASQAAEGNAVRDEVERLKGVMLLMEQVCLIISFRGLASRFLSLPQCLAMHRNTSLSLYLALQVHCNCWVHRCLPCLLVPGPLRS